MSGVALAAGTAAELVVDAPALVALGAEHEQAAGRERLLLQAGDLRLDVLHAPLALRTFRDVLEFLLDAHVGIAAELDVGAAPGHVGGDSDGARHARLR